MKSLSRPKKVIGILGTLILIFLVAYFVKNINFNYSYFENDSDSQEMVKYGNYFYFNNAYATPLSTSDGNPPQVKGGLIRIKKNGKGYKTISSDVITSMAIYGNDIYYSKGIESNGIYKMKTDGTGKKKIYSDIAQRIKIYEGYIYFLDESENRLLLRIKPDGSELKIIAPLVDDYTFYNDKIYFSTNTDIQNVLTINMVSLNGGDYNKICVIPGWLCRIANDKIYYLSQNNTGNPNGVAIATAIYSVDMHGNSNKKMCEKIVSFYSIFDKNIYFWDDKGKCYSSDLDFKNIKLIDSKRGISIFGADKKNIYFTEYAGTGVYSMDKNGENIKQIFDVSKVK